jgi:hypothetical protein
MTEEAPSRFDMGQPDASTSNEVNFWFIQPQSEPSSWAISAIRTKSERLSACILFIRLAL